MTFFLLNKLKQKNKGFCVLIKKNQKKIERKVKKKIKNTSKKA